MRETFLTFVLVIMASSFFYLVGHSLIDAYFRRKEKFVNKLQQNLKGGSNGPIK